MILVAGMAACSSGKKVTTTPLDSSLTGLVPEPIAVPKDSADNVFIDAVKAKILGNKEEAFRKYALFAASNPGNAAAHYELSRLWLERSDIPKAMGEIRIALQHDSLNKWMLKQYADLLSYDEQYTAAATIYGKIASRERAPEEFMTWEALLYQKAGKYKEALAVMDKLAQFTGADDEMMILQKQQLYLSMNNVEAAAGEVKKLIGYYPGESRYALLLAELYDNNNVADKAADAYHKAETLFPDDASVQFALVQYYLKKKNFPLVEQYMERAVLNRNIGAQDRIDLLAPFLQYRGTDSTARNIAYGLSRKMAEQEPLEAEAISAYGDLLSADNRDDDAMAQYKRAIAVAPKEFANWQRIMFQYMTRGENDSLIAYCNEAIKIFPKEPMAYYFAGLGYIQLKQNDNAIAFLDKAVRNQPRNNYNLLSQMMAALGDAYNFEKQYSSSDSAYKAALELQPNNASALNNYSYYLSERGEYLEEAEKMSAKSLKLQPGEATFMDTYGWVLYRQGKYKDARVYVLKAIETNAGDADATLWEHLGDIEYRLGNADEALKHWKTALSKDEGSESLKRKINEKKLHD